MTIDECAEDFNQFGFGLGDGDYLLFNTLRNKQTNLTTPSIVCYITIGHDEKHRPYVEKVIKCFLSLNPSMDIEKDKDIFDTFDEILIRHNEEHNNKHENQTLSKKQTKVFNETIERILQNF